MLALLWHGCVHCRQAARSIGQRVGTLFLLDHRGGLSELYQCMRCGALWEGTNDSFQPISTRKAHARYPAARAALEEVKAKHESAPQREGIDPVTGAIVTDQGRIDPTITKSQFLASPLFGSGAWTNQQDGWYAAETMPLTIAGEPLACKLRFHFEELHSVEFMSTDPRYGTSWEDHNWEQEAARNDRHEQWLRATIGLKRTYRWGKIWCSVDTKAGFASIAVTYNHWRAT